MWKFDRYTGLDDSFTSSRMEEVDREAVENNMEAALCGGEHTPGLPDYLL